MFYLPNKEDKFYIEEVEMRFPFDEVKKFERIFTRLELIYNKKAFKTGDEIIRFLRKHRYNDDQIMSKVRKIYSDGSNEITIDNVDQVGTVIELECAEDDPLRLVKDFLGDDEWDRDLEGTSYIWLRKVKGLTSHLNNLKKFGVKPDWNVWDNEADIYVKIQGE